MKASRKLAALVHLPALARSRAAGTASRYVRQQTKTVAAEGVGEEKRFRRRDGVRELSITSLQRASRGHAGRETYVPYLRLAGRWLEQNGFEKDSRVFVQVEPGRLIVTTEDPARAIVGSDRA